MKEIWKDIPNYEGLYQASNLGNIKSLERKIFNSSVYGGYSTIKEKILKPHLHPNGCNKCLMIVLYSNGLKSLLFLMSV